MSGFAERRWRSPDGLSLAARDYPGADGPARTPVICLHGLTRNSRDFEDLAPWIAAQGRRVIAADMRGRGRSDRDPKPEHYAVPVYVGDVAALLDQAGIGRAVFVGTSMGGLITMGMAGFRPQAVAGAVLNDIGPKIESAGLARIASYAGDTGQIADWDAAAARAKAVNAAVFPHYGPDDWMAFARRTFREGPDGRPQPDYDPAIARSAAAAADPNAEAVLWPLFTALASAGPVLSVRGATSDILSAETAAAMARAGADVRTVEVPGVGHAPMLDEAPARAAIKDLLAKAP